MQKPEANRKRNNPHQKRVNLAIYLLRTRVFRPVVLPSTPAVLLIVMAYPDDL